MPGHKDLSARVILALTSSGSNPDSVFGYAMILHYLDTGVSFWWRRLIPSEGFCKDDSLAESVDAISRALTNEVDRQMTNRHFARAVPAQ